MQEKRRRVRHCEKTKNHNRTESETQEKINELSKFQFQTILLQKNTRYVSEQGRESKAQGWLKA
jgi:hypothetical protein